MAPTPTAARPARQVRRARDDGTLLRRWRRERDPADRDALVARFLPLAHHLAQRYRTGADREDVMQVAALALLKALDRYDPDRGIAFTSFAVPTILGEIKRYYRDQGWSVRVPRHLQELGQQSRQARDQLSASLGRQPTVHELAGACDTTVELVLEALAASGAHYAISLDQRRPDDDEQDLRRLTCHEPGYDSVDAALEVRARLAPLPPRERQMMLLRFEDDFTQQEIAGVFGLTQMQVSRILRRCLEQLSTLN